MKLHNFFTEGSFSPPASEKKIAEVEDILSVKLPAQLSELLLECDGFRENLGNSKYLLSLTEKDFIGSIVSTNQFMWNEVSMVNLKPFIFFGYSSGDEAWGIRINEPHDIIAYHHHMEDEYEEVGKNILDVDKSNYHLYDEL